MNEERLFVSVAVLHALLTKPVDASQPSYAGKPIHSVTSLAVQYADSLLRVLEEDEPV